MSERPPATAPSSALLTDHYELTMLQAALKSGEAHRRSVFEVFGRRLPEGRRYGVVAGTGRFLEALRQFRFASEEIDFLADTRVVDDATLQWLSDYSFSGSIRGYAEGEIYFPHSPLLVVESSFAEGVILETLALSVLNHDSAVASAASRMSAAAGERPCSDMGSRRTHERSAVAAARAAVIGGFSATSNLQAGREYGVRTIGTSAHAFTLLYDTEREAFEAQIAAFGTSTTLLLDTYDVPTALRTAIDVAGPGLAGVRLDSGDLPAQAAEVRAALDALGATETAITVTSDLDEYAIAALAASPVDYYGVGTRLVTGSGAPTASLVYKLVARQDDEGAWHNVAKTAAGKASVGGTKVPVRALDPRGVATEELIGIGAAPADSRTVRPLHVDLVRDGEVLPGLTGPEAVPRAAERHLASRAELPRTALRLQQGEPAIPTTFVTPEA